MDVDDQVAKIAMTFQSFEFLELGSKKADYLNRLSLPITPRNKKNIGLVSPLQSLSSKTRENLSVRIVQNGIEVVPSGVCQIVSVQDRIQLDVQSGVRGFWDLLEGLYLNDLDLSTWNGLWDNDRRDSVRNATAGLVSAVVNSGQLVDSGSYVNAYTYGTAMIPFLYYHTIMEQLFALVGYAYDGSIFGDTDRYSKMVVSCGFDFSKVWLAAKKFTAVKTSSQSGSGFGFAAIKITFQTFVNGTDGFFDSTNHQYLVDNPDTALEYFSGRFSFIGRATYSVEQASVELRINGVAMTNAQFVFNGGIDGDKTLKIITDVYDLKDGDDISMWIFGPGNDPGENITVESGVLTFLPSNSTNTNIIQDTDWYIYFNQLLPRITLKAFIKDFMMMFGLVMTEKNNTVTFSKWEEILTDILPSSAELSKQNKSVKLELGYNVSPWCRNNYFYWVVQSDEAVIDSDYGSGNIEVDNDVVAESREVYTSIFTASDQVTENKTIDSAQITIYNSSGPAFTKAISFGFRLLLLRADDGVNVRFKTGTDRTGYFIGYFIDKNQSFTLDFQEIVNEHYNTYKKVLGNYADANGEFLINQVQALSMSLTKPMARDGVLYIAEKVGPFVSGEFSNFKLIRLLIN